MTETPTIARGQVWIGPNGQRSYVCCVSRISGAELVEYRNGDFQPVRHQSVADFVADKRLNAEETAMSMEEIARHEGRR